MQLPDIDYEEYQESFHGAAADQWSRPLGLIGDRHGLDMTSAKRSESGRNVVILAGDWVVKLVPPFWEHMWERERLALQRVHGRLSVRTPALQAAGRVDSWPYIVMERVEGASLGWRAELGSAEARTSLAALQGRLAREISQLERVEPLRWEWGQVIEEDRRGLRASLVKVPAHLAGTAADYVAAAGDMSSGNTVLHGDLASINLLFAANGDPVLIDWSDASVGPADHEFISPFMHQFRGNPDDLEAFWGGYGVVADPAATRHRIMARSILKYATLLPGYLEDLPGPMPASWAEAADRFTRIP